MRAALLLLFPLVAHAGPLGPPGRPPHPPPPPPHVQLVERADELGISPENAAAITQIAEAARPAIEAAAGELREAQEALAAEVSAQRPDRDAVLAASAALAVQEHAFRDARLEVALALRTVVTAEQWAAVAPPFPPPFPPERR